MKVRDVMTTDVTTAAPDTSLKEVAASLVEGRISGLPVVDSRRRVLGVVSEADIIRKETGEEAGDGKRDWLGRTRAPHYDRLAGEAMTSPPITVGPEREVVEAARLMSERAVNRLPVVENDGTLVGIVTRADLVRAFLRTDDEIEREIREDLIVGTLWIDPADVFVSVDAGEVRLAGKVDTKADAKLLERFAARVPGVVSVRSTLHWRVDARPERYQHAPTTPRP